MKCQKIERLHTIHSLTHEVVLGDDGDGTIILHDLVKCVRLNVIWVALSLSLSHSVRICKHSYCENCAVCRMLLSRHIAISRYL